MTDRELLELAAKAAGKDIEWQPCDWAHDNETLCEWNPLENDGDAFRLAAKLKLQVSFGTFKDDECVGYQIGKRSIIVTGKNLEAAAREVIVRTAAKIGKEMK
jgi:hypothetical protein